MTERKCLCILGNCVAQRLGNMLTKHPDFSRYYKFVPLPMIHEAGRSNQRDKILKETARKALSCPIILTQPLFNFAECNTTALRSQLGHGQELITFSSPDFEGYFPDIGWLKNKTKLQSRPIFDWESRIIFACYVNGVSIFQVEDIYLHHPMFHPSAMRRNLAHALERYAVRDQDVELPTLRYVLSCYKKRRLFYSSMHPSDDFLSFMYAALLKRLDLPLFAVPVESFSFNQWTLIDRTHTLFQFPEQPFIIVGNTRSSIEDFAMASYIFYKNHPHIVQANLELAEHVLQT